MNPLRRIVTITTAAARRIRGTATIPSNPYALLPEQATGPIPTDEQVVAAAYDYEDGRLQYNAGNRLKSRASKVLKNTPDGIYGPWRLDREQPLRDVPDMAEIARIFKERGLGDVPMKPCAPSIKLTFIGAEVPDTAEPVAAAA